MRWFCLAALAALLPSPAIAQDAPRKPNVLFIIADDLAAHAVGAYGNQLVRTPNLDKLAAAGVRFDQAFCNSPVCTASRQSFLTGRYPRTVGVTQLRTALPASETTLATLLAKAGYRTAAIGKMHFNSDLKHGFEHRLDLPDYRQWLKQKGPTPLPKDVEFLPQWRPFKDPARVWLNSGCLPYPAVDADMAGTYFANEAVKYLQQHRGEPFFLMVSFTEPHSPFHFPAEFRGRHKPESIPVPKIGPEDAWHIPAVFRDVTPRETQGITAAYYTSVEFLDRNIGIVLAALEKLGLDRNTLIIFIGDHGYLLGHHGRFEKHCLFLEAIRAPLLIRVPPPPQQPMPPPAPKRRNTGALVEFIDIAPTILSFCGQDVPKTIQGKSLLPLLKGATDRHRDAVFVEYSENEEAAIRTERWHLIYGTGKRARQDGYATGKPLPGRTVLLYDNVNDPGQMTNLARRPESAKVVEELTARLAEHLRRTARQPELLPRTDDVHELLEFCLQPRDVPTPVKKKGP
jgi:choline-sulfatase